jgi:RNA polymerase sigma-54 factor
MVQLSQTMRLEQRLSPQQILLSTLLQLPILSLEQKIQTELEINPVLEEGLEEEQENEVVEGNEEEQEEVEKEIEMTDTNGKDSDLDTKELTDAQADSDWETLLNDEDSYEIKLPRDRNEEDYERPEVVISTLTDHLMEQLNYLSLNEKDHQICEYLIWNIKDDGYLDESLSLESVAQIFDCEVAQVEEVLKKIHFFDPLGIGSRNLRECLLAQLVGEDGHSQLVLSIVLDHFEDFKNKRYERIMDELDIDQDALREAIEEIVHLNPKPGEGLYNSKHNYIVPDFMVEEINNEFVVTLNDWNIPPLRISNTYRQILQDKRNKDKETKQYIRKKIESAKWFINSIYQRKVTMLNVMQAIVEKQYDFFAKGPTHIKPLIMREIADIIEMDISTVSRVANGKYVQTDYGIFELKYFFNERIETEEGEEISTRKIKNRIQEMIESEESIRPMSDEKISQQLSAEGFPIARRTVAKYREQLDIPVARLRKKI